MLNLDNGQIYKVEYDGFVGEILGRYTTREGKKGVVMQQLGTQIVHVYNVARLTPVEEEEQNDG